MKSKGASTIVAAGSAVGKPAAAMRCNELTTAPRMRALSSAALKRASNAARTGGAVRTAQFSTSI